MQGGVADGRRPGVGAVRLLGCPKNLTMARGLVSAFGYFLAFISRKKEGGRPPPTSVPPLLARAAPEALCREWDPPTLATSSTAFTCYQCTERKLTFI